MDFLVEENLKAHISCWYIKKYIDEHPQQHYKELVITWLQPVCPVEPGILPQINYNLTYLNAQDYRGQMEDVKLPDLHNLQKHDHEPWLICSGLVGNYVLFLNVQ